MTRVQPTAYSLQPIVYSLQLTAYSLQLTAYSLQPTAYSLQLTAYSLQPTRPLGCQGQRKDRGRGRGGWTERKIAAIIFCISR
jgi:hypothetical protein